MELPVMTVTVDIVVLTITDVCLQVVLVGRGVPPHEGKQTLPGGFVLPGESIVDAARRELVEETDLGLDATHLEQLITFGGSRHDPGSRVVSAAYLASAAFLDGLTLGSDASGTRWHPVDGLPSLALNHDEIPRTRIEQARAKLEYTAVATRLCGPRFTVIELWQAHETV